LEYELTHPEPDFNSPEWEEWWYGAEYAYYCGTSIFSLDTIYDAVRESSNGNDVPLDAITTILEMVQLYGDAVDIGQKSLHDIINIANDPTGIVYNQNAGTIPNMRYGDYSMSWNGCELIAIYNAIQLLGGNRPLSTIINDFEHNGGMLLQPFTQGYLGSNPFYIEGYMYSLGYSGQSTVGLSLFTDWMSEGGTFIMSIWNTAGKPLEAAHTFAVQTTVSAGKVTYTTYNRFGYSSDHAPDILYSMVDLLHGGAFIVGTRVY